MINHIALSPAIATETRPLHTIINQLEFCLAHPGVSSASGTSVVHCCAEDVYLSRLTVVPLVLATPGFGRPFRDPHHG